MASDVVSQNEKEPYSLQIRQNDEYVRDQPYAERFAPATAELTRENGACGPTAFGWAQWFAFQAAREQASGLPASSRRLSEATPSDRVPKSPFEPEGVAELRHPSRMQGPATPPPRVFGALRPPATLCEPFWLMKLDERLTMDERRGQRREPAADGMRFVD